MKINNPTIMLAGLTLASPVANATYYANAEYGNGLNIADAQVTLHTNLPGRTT